MNALTSIPVEATTKEIRRNFFIAVLVFSVVTLSHKDIPKTGTSEDVLSSACKSFLKVPGKSTFIRLLLHHET